ncbi:MAG: MBL fold metallo-hydrolase [Myxococcales bacterium]|nr:MBL fold metallo-hydrolase [Myxococcales bacterium]MCB9569774.1 MBL fold metallo-hydrolase [Myxococcales bacterium]
MKIEAFFDPRTYTLTYVVFDPETHDAVIIDPVLDYEPIGSKVFGESTEKVLAFVHQHELKVHFILETHAHADHLSGSQELRRALPGAEVVIGDKITAVQELFRGFFDLGADFPVDGSQFDRLIGDEESITAGTLSVKAIATPGHTPACVSYLIGDAVFTGDALFMPDYGTGRCDFPAGSARDLYASITRRLYALPDETRVFVGHDYLPGGRDVAWESTIAAEKEGNVQLPAGRSEAEFIAFREARDATLAAPKLLYQSVQVNIDAGRLPAPAENGRRFLKIPLNIKAPAKSAD